MSGLTLYILKSAVYISVFLAIYMLMMRKTTFFRLNRIVFLAGTFICLILPAINVALPENVLTTMPIPMILEEVEITGKSAGNFPLDILEIIFLSGALVTLAVTARSYIMMRKMMSCAEKTDMDGISVRITDSECPSFSWGRNIVISRKDIEENPAVLIHEKMHIRCCHSIDLLLYSLVTVAHWFNPLVWIARTELKILHEYEADELTIKQGINITQYQLLLVMKAVGTRQFQLANGFNHSKLKNRITMMYKNKTNKWMRLAYLVCIPALALTMCCCSQNKNKQENADVSAPETVEQTAAEPMPFSEIDVKPSFNGGDAGEFAKWIGTQMTYPEECKEEGVEGRVMVNFTIGTDGKVTDVKVLRGVHEKLDAEAVRVISISPDWAPGMHEGKAVPVSFTIPIMFKFNE
ncbi:MAG: M56 family metallopeptidase [Bacteroidales bacterium]|nr:M56 family metallopeptidase [Bacteroidales bacterium]